MCEIAFYHDYSNSQHGGGGGGGAGARPGRNRYAICALASCRIPRFLLVLLEGVGDFMQTLHLIEKVCIKSDCQILADMQTFAKSAKSA